MKKFLFLLIPFALYLLGIWDIDGLRQGTETFYLKIAREMGDQFSILTPLHGGSPHWSKPPFVFWISLPFYLILPFDHHTSSRLSMILFTILTSLFISREVHRNTKNSITLLFLILVSSFGFFRYGKIFMMDIPLATLSTLSILYFYNSQRHQKKNLLIYGIITLACAILVKGPVSLVMIGSSLFFYGLLHKQNRQKEMLINGSFYLFGGTLLASIWFLLCYFKYGSEFIDYFFLRENLGKFESQTYPARKILQGLILYGLPWSLFLFPQITKLKNLNLESIKAFTNKKFESFLFISFLCFFLIWFIPTQRSHHYAIPALPFFLILIFPILSRVHARVLSYVNITLFSIFGLIGFGLGIRFIDQFHFTPIFIAISLIVVSFFSFKAGKEVERQGLIFLMGLSIIWSLLIPQFSLPKLPTRHTKLIETPNVASVFKKNYYFEQVLGFKLNPLHAHEVANYSKHQKSYFILTEQFFESIKANGSFEKLATWPVWKRRVKWPQIKQALLSKNLSLLQENYVLLKSTSID